MINRRALCGLLAPTISVGLAGCGESSERELVVEAARATCAAVPQLRFGSQSDDKPVLMERVSNSSADADKFEFAWKPAQISGLSARSQLAEETPPPGSISILRELHVDAFICRGSLKERSMFGLSAREITIRGQPNEFD